MPHLLGSISVVGDINFDGVTVSCNNARLDVSFKTLILNAVSEALEVSEHELALMLTSSNEADRAYAQAINILRHKTNNE